MPQIITNKYNLPDPIVKAVKLDTHPVAGNISVSELIDSPRIRMMKKMFTYEVDVSDMLEALLGTAVHAILERANIDSVRKRAFLLTIETLMGHTKTLTDDKKREGMVKVIQYLKSYSDAVLKEDPRYVAEQTLSMDIDGTIVYGTVDLYDSLLKSLEDYKSCKVWAWTFPESRKKWTAQTNVYTVLLRANGYEVNNIVINALFKDWSNGAKFRSKDYPDRKMMRLPVEMADPVKMAKWIAHRVQKHKEAEAASSEATLPYCTGTERWASADSWAVKATPNTKRALRVFDDQGLADGFIQENGYKYKEITKEYRAGFSQRCAEYCPVAQHCSQYKAELKLKQERSDEE